MTARSATSLMLDLPISRWGLSDVHAYILCSVALRLRLSHVVNEPVYTVSGQSANRYCQKWRSSLPHECFQ